LVKRKSLFDLPFDEMIIRALRLRRKYTVKRKSESTRQRMKRLKRDWKYKKLDYE